MLIGYARVSTKLQDTEVQINCLKVAGCEMIFHETESGGRWNRPQLHAMMEQLKSGDIVVCWKLDRLSRSLKDMLIIMEKIDKKGCGFKSLTETVDTTTSGGKMMMQIIGAFAEFERSMLKERILSGLAEAKRKGRKSGRKHKLSEIQQKEAISLVKEGKMTSASVSRLFSVHPSVICRLMQKE